MIPVRVTTLNSMPNSHIRATVAAYTSGMVSSTTSTCRKLARNRNTTNTDIRIASRSDSNMFSVDCTMVSFCVSVISKDSPG